MLLCDLQRAHGVGDQCIYIFIFIFIFTDLPAEFVSIEPGEFWGTRLFFFFFLFYNPKDEKEKEKKQGGDGEIPTAIDAKEDEEDDDDDEPDADADARCRDGNRLIDPPIDLTRVGRLVAHKPAANSDPAWERN